MSTSSFPPLHETSDITCITPEPFEPAPLISDILRTGYCVPGSIFLVEGIDSVHTSKSQRWRAVHLLLGDGKLCIQALLSADMHRFLDEGELALGSYIKLERFRMEWKDVRSKNSHGSEEMSEKMVYLVVEDLVLVGWNNFFLDGHNLEHAPAESTLEPMTSPIAIEPRPENRGVQCIDRGTDIPREVIQEEDDFEVMPNAAAKATQKRLDLTTRPGGTAVAGHNSTEPDTSYLPWASIDCGRPLKLTKLRSIPKLPYKQNWSVNVLAVVSAISDIEPSGLPPYTQRRVRLTDPSTNKHVRLDVFLDPETFTPLVGSVILLLGVKNHRFDGGSLKKYASDRPKEGYSWWYENPVQFDWCDVEKLRQWWLETSSIPRGDSYDAPR
ncbi:uncharacterized protein GGS25DRAFT_155543 [Hypoxylon fragiforme]|uniref:uncharacterized protein n=1 Tax=Hypoxylon fragiforme TaxID=63214 RepID=UPI0020C715EA|nr:uncharacterized protein GGS25DRAFT_155543 [Hypoxylon fragiforme]KAI2610627.1 hypothetical protein GGS25DRAFT_155543 [Hypoxylon fragiforme]